MYYRDCTPAYAVEVIKEIIENAGPMQALTIIRNFLDENISTDDIQDLF